MSDDTLTVDELEATEPAGDTPPATGAAGGDELSQVTAERDEYLDTLRRLQAEFENFRRRARREQDAAVDRATSVVIEKLLPVLDAFDAARVHQPDALGPIDGVLYPALAALGVERVDPLGEPFDPEAHEAVAVNVDDEKTVGDTVVEVLRVGYRCRGHLLRPATVRVGEESQSRR